VAATEALVYVVTSEDLMPILAARPALFEAISELVALRRVDTTRVLAEAAMPQSIEQVRGIAAQVLGKMKTFFATIAARHHGLREAVQGGD
jgi:hypothetical protein